MRTFCVRLKACYLDNEMGHGVNLFFLKVSHVHDNVYFRFKGTMVEPHPV